MLSRGMAGRNAVCAGPRVFDLSPGYTELIWQIGPSIDPLPYLMNMHPAARRTASAGASAGSTYLVRQLD